MIVNEWINFLYGDIPESLHSTYKIIKEDLNKKWKEEQRECDICGEKNWNMAALVTSLILDESNDFRPGIPYSFCPKLELICNNCGNTKYLNVVRYLHRHMKNKVVSDDKLQDYNNRKFSDAFDSCVKGLRQMVKENPSVIPTMEESLKKEVCNGL